MLDLKTLLFLELATTSLQAIAWLLVWLAWRHLYELKVILAGFVAIALGILLLLQRGPDPVAFRIVLDNTVIKLGLILLADGLARFLGQPSLLRIGALFLAVHLCVWSLIVAFAPADLALRLHASTVMTFLVMSLMIRTLYVDRSQPSLLRWIMIALLAEYIGASLLQSALVYLYPATVQNGPILSNINAWYIFQGSLFIMGYFICLLFMVGMRLSLDLRDRNAALAREVCERRRLEGELSASLDAEKSARQEQHQLMRMVSHEFRTPLAAIRYASEMLDVMLKDPQEAVKKRLHTIGEAVSRMSMLIDRFLASDRHVNGVVKAEKIDFPALADEVRNHFAQVELNRRLTFTRVDTVQDYWADTEMLRTVIVNLVDNALKYSPPETMVEIAFFVRNHLLVIEVADRGIGIPNAEHSHLGRRFFRGSNTAATAGSGLGLHNCRQLLGYHDGSLNLSARMDGGTIATVRLPLDVLRPDSEAHAKEEVGA